jgi:hypothetical protein
MDDVNVPSSSSGAAAAGAEAGKDEPQPFAVRRRTRSLREAHKIKLRGRAPPDRAEGDYHWSTF